MYKFDERGGHAECCVKWVNSIEKAWGMGGVSSYLSEPEPDKADRC